MIKALPLLVVVSILGLRGQPVSATKPELSEIKVNSYKPTAQDLLQVHQAFLASQQSLQNQTASREPPPSTTNIILRNVTSQELNDARTLVAAAHASQAAYNKWNMENPHFNHYVFKGPGDSAPTKDTKRNTKNRAPEMKIPKFSQETLDAIKLVGDVDAQDLHNNGTLQRLQGERDHCFQAQFKPPTMDTFLPGGGGGGSKRGPQIGTDEWWYEMVDHSKASQPFGGNDSYKVWRNVKDYGAVGDGVHDDTEAIQKAISDGNRCGANCPGSTTTGAVVYIPYGTYKITGSIVLYFNTQLITSPSTPATLQAATSFTGNGLLSTDVYLSDGTSEWYVNTANFYRQVRYLQIDMRLATLENVKAIHWQTAQATSIDGVGILLSNDSSTTQVGIFAENGSGGWFSDIIISGGYYGFLGGSQQYSVANLQISGSRRCLGMIWDWAWSWTQLHLDSCTIAIDFAAPGSQATDPVGSVLVVDSKISNCEVAVRTYPFAKTEQGSTVLSFNNVLFTGCTYFIFFTDSTALAQDVSHWQVSYWQYGDLEHDGATSTGYYTVDVNRPLALVDPTNDGAFFRRPKPSYKNIPLQRIMNAKQMAKGDGKSDDTKAIQSMLNYCAQNDYILYVPAGSYMIYQPLTIPNNSYVFGESWSQFVAVGPEFAVMNSPAPMITVGSGEHDGVVELQNLLFTSQGALPGLVLVQWNIKAAHQGSVALWDCHFRVGGAKGTNLQVADCPRLSGAMPSRCIAGSIMLVMAALSNGYFENMWAWVADHDIDYPSADTSGQIDIYFARGILMQGEGPNWFRGTSSEHSVFYQYNLVSTNNTYMSMIQTESPYFQGVASTQAPAPFHTPQWIGDPVFDMCGSNTTSCNMAWAIIIRDSNFIFIDGAGLYSWFQNYNQACVNTKNCQQRLINIYNTGSMLFNHIVTIGSVEVVTPGISNQNNEIIYADNHLQATQYPWWTTIATYLDSSASIAAYSTPSPVKNGWVAFGDSYAAGIGAGTPLDKDFGCRRGTGSYPAILNAILQFGHLKPPKWQALPCSGETATNFLANKGNFQLDFWKVEQSDFATVSFTGNDVGFGPIVSHCIMGFRSRSNCNSDIAAAVTQLDNNVVRDLTGDVLAAIFKKVDKVPGKERFIVYWTGYPQFFDTSDKTCDTNYFHEAIYAGNYLTQALRQQFNELSNRVNKQIDDAIGNFNANLPYPQVVFVSLDERNGVYNGRRFCEPGRNETLKTKDEQDTVAFFYDNGWDDIPSASESFIMPNTDEVDAPPDWAVVSYNSGNCTDGDAGLVDPLENMLCSMAKEIAAGDMTAAEFTGSGGVGMDQVTVNSDATVTVIDFVVRFMKMFHPKTRANWHIAQAINGAFRLN